MKILYCIQNKILEDVLLKNRIINKNSEIIRNKNELTHKKVSAFNPDYIMFPHWSYMVPENIFNEYKCICFHSSPLPFGRGGSPIQNMILEGYKETEVCSLLMEKDLDAGPVYLRTKIELSGNLNEILIRIYNAIAKQIKVFKNKEIYPIAQKGIPYKFKRLNAKDNSIKLNLDINSIYDQIRMLDSEMYPNAYISIGDYIIDFMNPTKHDNFIDANVKIHRKIFLRGAKISDAKEIWKWRNDPLTRSMFKNKDYVEFKDHIIWYRKKLKDQNTFFYIGESFGVKAGIVRIDHLNNEGEVSINMNPDLRGMSLSETLLKDSINSFLKAKPLSELVAYIDKKNLASIRLFQKVGFTLVESKKNLKTFRIIR